MENNKVKNPNWQEATSWLFTSVAKDLNSEQLRTNSASSEGGTWNSGPLDRVNYKSGTALTTRPRHLGKLNLHFFLIITVKPHFTDTHFIQTPLYYGQLALSLGKEIPLHFLHIQPTLYGHHVNTNTFYGPVIVQINAVWL